MSIIQALNSKRKSWPPTANVVRLKECNKGTASWECTSNTYDSKQVDKYANNSLPFDVDWSGLYDAFNGIAFNWINEFECSCLSYKK